jgi:hypothetical protein
MAQTTNVGDQTPTGAGENTNSPVSPENGQPIAGTPQSSQEVLELKKSFETLSKELKGLQSRQDKGLNEVQSFMAEVKKQMASGKSLEEAEAAVNASREAQVKDDLLFKMARKLGVLDDVSQNPAGNGGTVTEAAAQVISELKLDANTPEVVSILAKGYNAEKQELELRRLATRPRPQPSPAEAPSMQAPAPAASGNDTAQKIARLAELQKQPTKNKAEINQLVVELDKVGWK